MVTDLMSEHEAVAKKFVRRIQRKQGLTRWQAVWQTRHLLRLLCYLQTQKAYIVYQRPDQSIVWTLGTLLYYPITFDKAFDVEQLNYTIPYWHVRKRVWRTFKVECFIHWAPADNPYFLAQSLLN